MSERIDLSGLIKALAATNCEPAAIKSLVNRVFQTLTPPTKFGDELETLHSCVLAELDRLAPVVDLGGAKSEIDYLRTEYSFQQGQINRDTFFGSTRIAFRRTTGYNPSNKAQV